MGEEPHGTSKQSLTHLYMVSGFVLPAKLPADSMPLTKEPSSRSADHVTFLTALPQLRIVPTGQLEEAAPFASQLDTYRGQDRVGSLHGKWARPPE